jgi:hypothetical protein
MTLALILALVLAQPPADPAAWRFVVPPPGDPFEYPPPRALSLSRERPEDVAEKVHYRGHRRRYAQLRYGSPSSVRVTVVLDEAGPGDADLYVDADRNRRIEPRDLVEKREGRVWRLPLSAAVVEGEATRLVPRAAVFRAGATGLTFGFAASGYLEGRVSVAGRTHAARRQDGDGNGRFTDGQDRLWIDLDDDGRWDAATEQFLYAAILPLAGARYAVRSDEPGTRLSLEKLEGSGAVRLVRRGGGVVSATLVGRDGSAVAVGGEADVTLPAGEYRLGTLTLTLDDPAGGPRWGYVFSDLEGKPGRRWYKVANGARVEVDPVGALDLQANLADGPRAARGEAIRVQPRLYSGDGLSIVTCYRGEPTTPAGEDGPAARVALVEAGGRVLSDAHSGFA